MSLCMPRAHRIVKVCWAGEMIQYVFFFFPFSSFLSFMNCLLRSQHNIP